VWRERGDCAKCDQFSGYLMRYGRRQGWCYSCVQDEINAADRQRRADAREDHVCARCGETFTPTRTDQRYWCNACRQAAYRQRRSG
jgi:hypothetical protein